LSLGAVKVAVAIPAEAVASPPLATGDSLAGGAYVRPEERATGSHERGVWALPSVEETSTARSPLFGDTVVENTMLSTVTRMFMFGWGS
jgi:hypothetical protein